MVGLAILLAFQMAGVGLQLAGVPLPGAVNGLILLTVALFTGVVKVAWVEGAAKVLLDHMLLFFAPVIVGVLPLAGELRGELLPAGVALVGSLLAGLLVTGWTAQAMIPREPAGGGTA